MERKGGGLFLQYDPLTGGDGTAVTIIIIMV